MPESSMNNAIPATVENDCKICGAHGPHQAYRAREMMFGLREEFRYFECIACACLQIQVIPDDIERFYPRDYYAFNTSPELNAGRFYRAVLLRAKDRYAVFGHGILGRLLFQRAPEYDLRSLMRLHPQSTSNILDVGCGSGKLLFRLREIGFKNLLGVDPFIADDFSYRNGLQIRKRFLREMTGAWDIVMFHHAFEHMANPLETLVEVRRLLKPSGTCVIRIPKSDSYAWRHYRTDWVQLDAPRHFFLHSRASMDHLAHAAGMKIVAVQDDSTEFQFMGSELYRRDLPHKDYSQRYGDFFSRSQIQEFRTRSNQLNATGEGDSAAFYLTLTNEGPFAPERH